MGLKHYKLPDMDELAKISHKLYDNNLRGGEGHMEAGKPIHNVVDDCVAMTLSIKPFGCMPSNGISGGVQSLITEMYPQAIFLPIETNGDGAVNVYSRVQMQLFKAKQKAEKEVREVLRANGIMTIQFNDCLLASAINEPLYRSAHMGSSSAVAVATDYCECQKGGFTRLGTRLKSTLTVQNA